MEEIPVLIVGGGPVGLTASILLSRAGVRSLMVERHAGTAVHPKSRGINARTMEIFHQCGVEGAIRAAGLPQDDLLLRLQKLSPTLGFASENREWAREWLADPFTQDALLVQQCVVRMLFALRAMAESRAEELTHS